MKRCLPMFMPCAAILCVVATLLLAGCISGGGGPAPAYAGVPPESRWPLMAREDSALDRAYPAIIPATTEEREEAGKHFAEQYARIDAAALALLRDIVLVRTNCRGVFGAARYRLGLSQESKAPYRLVIDRVREGVEQHDELFLDDKFRLLGSTSRRVFSESSRGKTAFMRAIWNPKLNAGGAGTMLTGGYDVVLGDTTLTEERKSVTGVPQIPEDALPLIAMLAPAKSMTMTLPCLSAALRELCDAALTIRPSMGSGSGAGETEAGRLSALVQLSVRTPMSDSYALVINPGHEPRLAFGRVEPGFMVYPGTGDDYERVRAACALVEQERGRLLFNGVEVFSSSDSSGRTLPVQPDNHPNSATWLYCNVEPLRLAALSTFEADIGELASFYDEDSIGRTVRPTKLKVENNKLTGESAGERIRADYVLAAGQRVMTLGVDILPPGMALAEYAEAVSCMACRMSAMAGVTVRLFGAGYRIDLKPVDAVYRSAQGKRSVEVWHSILLIEREGVVIRAEYFAAGPEGDIGFAQLDEVFNSMRVKTPPGFRR